MLPLWETKWSEILIMACLQAKHKNLNFYTLNYHIPFKILNILDKQPTMLYANWKVSCSSISKYITKGFSCCIMRHQHHCFQDKIWSGLWILWLGPFPLIYLICLHITCYRYSKKCSFGSLNNHAFPMHGQSK